MGYKDWFVDSEIIALRPAEQGFERQYYFRSMRLHTEAFATIVQTKLESVTENFENIDSVLLSKLTELRNSHHLR